MKRPALTSIPFGTVVSCCISPPFGRLSTTWGQITYVLLTRAPLYRGCPFLARLACVKRAANVRSEPGSNSPVESCPPRPAKARWCSHSKSVTCRGRSGCLRIAALAVVRLCLSGTSRCTKQTTVRSRAHVICRHTTQFSRTEPRTSGHVDRTFSRSDRRSLSLESAHRVSAFCGAATLAHRFSSVKRLLHFRASSALGHPLARGGGFSLPPPSCQEFLKLLTLAVT
jgi:hypothetical protein